MHWWVIAGLLFGMLAPPAQAAPAKGEVLLYVPCGMLVPFTRLKTDFERRTGVQVKTVYDNGVMLIRRIRDKGERPDVLVAPGELEIRQAVECGRLAPESVVTFGTFKMILVVPARNRAGVRALSDLEKSQVRHIAIPDPDLNSAGFYAKRALQGVGLWDKVKTKVLTHWHAQEAVNYVCTGRVDAGVYYATCPFESAPDKLSTPTYKILDEIPESAYPPVRVQAGMLKAAKNKSNARRFLQYLMQPEAQKILAERGIPNFKETR